MPYNFPIRQLPKKLPTPPLTTTITHLSGQRGHKHYPLLGYGLDVAEPIPVAVILLQLRLVIWRSGHRLLP